jgi:hypothetical protein
VSNTTNQLKKHHLGWHYDDWSDFSIRLVVLGRPFSFKRAKRIIRLGARYSLGLTPSAKNYIQDAVRQLWAQWGPFFPRPIPKTVELNAAIRSYLPTRQLTDASNLYQGVEDAMQSCGPKCKSTCMMHAGVIEDDVQIRTHNGSDRLYNKENPRVEIVLTPYGGDRARRLVGAGSPRSGAQVHFCNCLVCGRPLAAGSAEALAGRCSTATACELRAAIGMANGS